VPSFPLHQFALYTDDPIPACHGTAKVSKKKKQVIDFAARKVPKWKEETSR
jgi:hypothetical protein